MQTSYAALDALCLLMLLDNMISCAPPQVSTQDPTPSYESAVISHACQQSAGLSARLASSKQHTRGSKQEEAGTGSTQPQGNATAAQAFSQNPAKSRTHSARQRGETASQNSGGTSQSPGNATTTQSTPGAQQQHTIPANRSQEHQQIQASATQSAVSAQQSTAAAAQSVENGLQCQDAESADEAIQQPSRAAAAQPSEHQEAIQQAVEHWACRLEMAAQGRANKPRAKRHLSRRQRAHIRHAVEQQNQIDGPAGMLLSAHLQSVPRKD